MAATCKACDDPLVLTLDPEDSGDEGQTVPDDLELPCGCHFHWQCLLDQSSEIVLSLKCPSCGAFLPTNAAGASVTNPFRPAAEATPILTRYANEGGVVDDLDIFPTLTEEAFLGAHPEARPARAMHTMAAEGDVAGIVELLMDVDSDSDVDATAAQLIRWTDPLNDGRSALHVALESNQEEVFWLLLWLGSAVHTSVFPLAAAQGAEQLGLSRGQVSRDEDVRFIKDEAGCSPAQILSELGPPWSIYVEAGLLN
ncbi:hypothetical protein B0T25DRAFT_261852 [Lasiosphaeria hispida]|uniref:Uncharacterized protein n=1 Tax=Lasiosphaeria hispida TaxID=260671 RepID=A0AAJ0HG56_9PEZI|nr:hypothetical protein B0T25DRAFT_261852 [Lasiosphaeria hispida]